MDLEAELKRAFDASRENWETIEDLKERVATLERAHIGIALRMLQLVQPTLGLQDDDITSFLQKHAEDLQMCGDPLDHLQNGLEQTAQSLALQP